MTESTGSLCARCGTTAPLGAHLTYLGGWGYCPLCFPKSTDPAHPALDDHSAKELACLRAENKRLTRERDEAHAVLADAAAALEAKDMERLRLDLCDRYARTRAHALNEERKARVAELEATLHRDRSGLSTALNTILSEIRSRSWLLESRGPYEWDDGRYKDEAGEAMRLIAKTAQDALIASGNLAHAECCGPRASLAATVPAEARAAFEALPKCGCGCAMIPGGCTPEKCLHPVSKPARNGVQEAD